MGLDESFLAQEGDGTAQLKVLAKTLPIHWHTWVRALVVTEGCRKKREKRVEGGLSTVAQQSEKDEKPKWVTRDAREVEACKDYY